jgi:hypothetical protein
MIVNIATLAAAELRRSPGARRFCATIRTSMAGGVRGAQGVVCDMVVAGRMRGGRGR